MLVNTHILKTPPPVLNMIIQDIVNKELTTKITLNHYLYKTPLHQKN